ncbi:MAG: BamA/TamA family outer membrane protein [Phascolarctobacterium sp.]|nr:BamA/TamA family outer membrane protein [Phascolarctobacterium sp.]
MKTKFMWRQLSMSVLLCMLAMPVYAANETAIGEPAQQTTANENIVNDNAVQQAAENNVVDIKSYIGSTITKQTITGNTVLSEDSIKSVLASKPGMEFTESILAEDINAIYGLGWFYDIRPEFKKVPEGVQITYHVMENPVYKGVKVTGNTTLKESVVKSYFDLEENKVANLQEINKCVAKLQEGYRNEGYILARVSDVHMEQDGTLNVTVNEGVIEGFKVKGNVKCKDYVITREMRMKTGQPFNAKLARRSMQRVYNLGFFEDVNVKLNPGRQPNSVEVEIDVVEQSTGTFGIGAGYSDADGFIGMITIGDRNFRGIGDSISIRWEFGGEDNKNYDFSYTRPWLDRHETKATINLYDITNEYADYDIKANEIARYDKRRVGQELTLSRKDFKNDFISNYITIKNRDDKYKGMADDYENPATNPQYYEDRFQDYYPDKYKSWMPSDYRERRKENFGSTRSLTIGRVYDSRDNIYDPHAGKRISYSAEWAGFMGGDFDFFKVSADYRYYWRAGGQCVWALNLGAGWADGTMPLSQRFTMGGSDTLRGYEDNQFRGNSMAKATMEFRFPIVKKVQGVLFTDNGYAWDKRHEDAFDFGLVKSSFGAGLRVNSPLGPIKLDYGWGDDGGKFHFSFGGQF